MTGPQPRNLALRVLCADLVAALIALMLPWSTSATLILVGIWLLALIPLIPVLDYRACLALLKQPICLAPLAIVGLSLLGAILATDIPWHDRMRGISAAAKLMVIPLFLYHFERSQRAIWVLTAFICSCCLLMILSWVVYFEPQFKITNTANDGVPIKNYIDQSQEFAICLVVLAPITMHFCRKRRYWWAALCGAASAGLFFNMAFVVSARAALVYLPVLLVIFAFRYLGRRSSALLLTATLMTGAAIWQTSDYWQSRIVKFAAEYDDYKQNVPASTGERITYWLKSYTFFAASPLIGHGTGSIRTLFQRDAVGRTGLAAVVTSNPHNQILNVAVQWGIVGVFALLWMWLTHFVLFVREHTFASWVGLLVVTQNIISSLFNSHIFDFHEGWMYVLGVGVAGGASLKLRDRIESYPAWRGRSQISSR